MKAAIFILVLILVGSIFYFKKREMDAERDAMSDDPDYVEPEVKEEDTDEK